MGLTLSIATPVAQALTQRMATLPIASVDAQQRVAALEASLGQLRSDARVTQALLAGLQTRLAEAQATARAPDHLAVYPLTWVAALLTLSILALGRLVWRESRHPTVAWWLAPPIEPAGALRRVTDSQPGTPPVWPPNLPKLAMPTSVGSAVPDQDASPMPPFQLGAGSDETPVPTLEAGAAGLDGPLSRQSLIDLEQHVDFFVALGQDDSAIELLMGLVRSDTGSSAMPYLKLLEIYRRRGDTEAYERIQERVSRRFNASAPAWSSESLAGPTPVPVAAADSTANAAREDATVDLLLPLGGQHAPFLFSDFGPIVVDLDLDLSVPIAVAVAVDDAPVPSPNAIRSARTRNHGTSAVEL